MLYLSPESASCYIVILLFFKYRLGLLTKILVWFQQIITTYLADHLKISFSDIQSTLANSLTELNIRFNFDVVFSPWMKSWFIVSISRQSMSWRRSSSPLLKKFRFAPATGKVIAQMKVKVKVTFLLLACRKDRPLLIQM